VCSPWQKRIGAAFLLKANSLSLSNTNKGAKKSTTRTGLTMLALFRKGSINGGMRLAEIAASSHIGLGHVVIIVYRERSLLTVSATACITVNGFKKFEILKIPFGNLNWRLKMLPNHQVQQHWSYNW
jgi:hypothetical protein